MDNIPEREQPKPERVILIGEELQLFDSKYTKQETSRFVGINNFKSQIKLSLGNNLEIPLHVRAIASYISNKDAITPFAPELGYQINSEDMSLESRLAKIKRLDKDLRQNIDFAKAPLGLDLETRNHLLHELGLNKNLAHLDMDSPKKC